MGEALRLEPGSQKLILLRARANSQAGLYEAAFADFSQVLDSKAKGNLLASERAAILGERAFAQLKQQRTDDARIDVESAMKIAPNNAFAIAVRGLIEEKLGQKTEAVASFKQALSIEPAMETAQRGLERLGQAAEVTVGSPSPAEPSATKRPLPKVCTKYFPALGKAMPIPCDR